MKRGFFVAVIVFGLGFTAAFGQVASKNKLAAAANTARPLTVELETSRSLAAKGQFPESEQHAAAALALDPESLTALVFLARTIKAQVRTDTTPENTALAGRAIDLYRRLLKRLPNDLEAFQALNHLYTSIGDQANQREWGLSIAQNGAFPNAIRVSSYKTLINENVACADAAQRSVSARPPADGPKGQPRTVDTAAVDRGIACGNEGLEFAGAMAILSPDDAAWRDRAKLLRALVNLTNKAGRSAESQNYQTQMEEAEKRAGMEDPIRAAGFVPTTPVDSRQVINGWASVIPGPSYPAEARPVNAQGSVYLNVTTDADGFVIAAELLSGHPLLRAAALNSAIWSRFDRTKMKTKNGILEVVFKSDQPGPPVNPNTPPGAERRETGPRWKKPH